MMFKDVMAEYQKTVEDYLKTLFTDDVPQKQLFDAMRYSLLAGGKRIRPILTLEFCRVCGGDMEKAPSRWCILTASFTTIFRAWTTTTTGAAGSRTIRSSARQTLCSREMRF